MKLKSTLAILAITLSIQASASDEKFMQAMLKHIDDVYKAATLQEYQSAVNAFDRIAGAEKSRWEPLYYSAFGNIMMAIQTSEAAKKDGYLDLALQALSKAAAMAPEESEIAALEGFVHMIRVTVDPQTRGMEFSMRANQAYEKALKLNPENPRAIALKAQMDFGTAQFFHAATETACQTNEKALLRFAENQSDNPLAPKWGESMAQGLKRQCSNTSKN